jgi:hypothetical protein
VADVTRRLVVLACGAGLVACSLGALDGFSGGTEPGAPDAAPEGGPIVTDAATEGTTPKRFCESLAQPATACADFDDAKRPPSFLEEQTGGGTIAFGGEGKDGTPGFASIVPSTAAADASACILVAVAGPRRALVVEADFRVETFGTENYEILNVDTESNRELGVSMTGTTMFIEEDYPTAGDQGERETQLMSVAKNTWQRLRFVLEAADGVARTELFVDGVSVGKHQGNVSTVTDSTKIELGDCQTVGADGWTVHYDNVVVYETK